MPTYDYRCEENGHEFEIVQGFNDAAEAACPACGSASQRKISVAALHFKGSGWYRKDNSSSSHSSSNGSKPESDRDSKSGKKESSDKSSSSSGSDSKSDSKASSGSGSSGSKTHSHGGSSHSH